MKRANLFVLGAQKSGTSSLHYYLKHVNDIYMCDAKETFFFARDDWHDYDAYHQQHYQNADAKYVGESSTAYTMQPAYPNVAPRLSEYNPDAKLIYIVRDPIERAISNYWWNVYLCKETRSLSEAIRADLQYQQTSDYALQIQPYLELFDVEQIKFVLFEDLKESPQKVIKQLCHWLEISFDVKSDDVFKIVRRKSGHNIDRIDTETILGKLRASSLWQRYLRNFLPNKIRQIGKPLATRTIDKNSVQIQQETEQVENYLRPLMQPKIEQFQQIVTLNYSKWTTLNA